MWSDVGRDEMETLMRATSAETRSLTYSLRSQVTSNTYQVSMRQLQMAYWIAVALHNAKRCSFEPQPGVDERLPKWCVHVAATLENVYVPEQYGNAPDAEELKTVNFWATVWPSRVDVIINAFELREADTVATRIARGKLDATTEGVNKLRSFPLDRRLVAMFATLSIVRRQDLLMDRGRFYYFSGLVSNLRVHVGK